MEAIHRVRGQQSGRSEAGALSRNPRTGEGAMQRGDYQQCTSKRARRRAQSEAEAWLCVLLLFLAWSAALLLGVRQRRRLGRVVASRRECCRESLSDRAACGVAASIARGAFDAAFRLPRPLTKARSLLSALASLRSRHADAATRSRAGHGRVRGQTRSTHTQPQRRAPPSTSEHAERRRRATQPVTGTAQQDEAAREKEGRGRCRMTPA